MKKSSLLLVVSVFFSMIMSSCNSNDKNNDLSIDEIIVDKSEIVMENILSRTSVRKFDTKKVEDTKVEKLLRAAMAAPTDRNLQPWHFIVLNTPESVAAYAGNGERAERVKNTPLIIVICGDTTRMQEQPNRELWIQDVSAATENLLLAAHALDLGAVWTTIYPLQEKIDETKERLHLPEKLIPLCAVRIGYPQKDYNMEPKNKWDEQKITYGVYR